MNRPLHNLYNLKLPLTFVLCYEVNDIIVRFINVLKRNDENKKFG
jgi:hypothetical protein